MRKDLEIFTSSFSQDYPIAQFPEGSLALYADGLLHILRGFTLLKNQTEYSQHVKITPVPSISSNVEIVNIKVSEDGSRVVLLSEDIVFVLLIELEMLTLTRKLATRDLYCECRKIVTKKVKNGVAKVLAVKFIPEQISPGCVLSILTSDNCLRLYNLICDTTEPVSEIDFNSQIIANGIRDDNTFGLYTTIVAYDLITSVSELCFLVIDSDGQLYAASLFDGYSPVIRLLQTPPELPTEPLALLAINHPFSQIVSAFAAISEGKEGNLTHFVVISSDNSFDVYVQEKISLPLSSSHISLSTFTNESTYFISTPNSLYLMDCTFWINQFGTFITGNESTSASEDTKVHTVATSVEPLPKTIHPTVGQTVTLKCGAEDGDVIMVLSRFASPKLMISFVRNQLSDEPRILAKLAASRSSIDWKKTTIDPIMSQLQMLPKLGGMTDDASKKLLKDYEQWLKKLSSNVGIMQTAVEASVKRLYENATLALTIIENRHALYGRLTTLGSELTNVYDEIAKRRKRLDVLNNRIDSLVERASEKRPLTAQEKQMLKMLKEYRREALNLCNNTAQLSQNAAEERLLIAGKNPSFQPSLSSYWSTTERHVREVESIKDRCVKLEELLSS